ncbi:MAG TPA: hypothetical protein VFA70_09690 [Dehalococcoidia bacterium]|jgi:hypothetical protein|nr:hypothetical protein [Dehalococcoidia bacterium]
MKSPPADGDVMLECPLCGQALTYADARALPLHPAMNDDSDSPGALRASGVLECRCGRTAVKIEQRGNARIVIPRPGVTLGGAAGPDSSVVL